MASSRPLFDIIARDPPLAVFVDHGRDRLDSEFLLLKGRLKLDELITGRYPLEQINEAMESVERGEALRNVIVF